MKAKSKAFFTSPPFPLKKEHLQTDAYYGMNLSRIGPGLVMSRSVDGSIISLFDDDEWFFPAYEFSVRDNPYFDFRPFKGDEIFNSENIATCKRLFTIKMFSTKSKTGKALRLPTMYSLMLTLNSINSYCTKQRIRIEEIFSSTNSFKDLQNRIPTSFIKPLLGLVRTLIGIDSKERGFAINGSILPLLVKHAREVRNDGDQHAVLPSRILWIKYQQYKKCLNDYLRNQSNIHKFIDDTIEDRFLGRNESSRFAYPEDFALLPSKKRIAYTMEFPTFWKTVENYNLTKLANEYDWKTIHSAASFLSLVQYCAKCLIHLFTLMRDSEVLNLPVDCLEPIRGWNNEALYVCGTSTKLEGEKTEAKWITTDDILEPVEILQSIQKLIISHVKDTHNKSWLLLTHRHLQCRGPSSFKDVATAKNLDRKLPAVIITEADIRELETIDPYRNWRDDKRFLIGQPWRVVSHQFRRSIAVFAGQSGLVTLPSLKRLLRHLTKVMSAYYMQGCSAQNYLFSDLNPELTVELRRAKEEANAALFIRDALNSAEQLYGFAGRRAMDMRKESVWLAGTKFQTAQQVKLGLMSYEETPPGGCVSPGPCDKRAHAKMDACPTCKQFLGLESKMDETVDIMEFDLEGLKKGTIEYRAELQNLEDFKALRARIIARG